MATQRKCWELLTTEVILVDQKWHRAIITGQSRSRKGTVGNRHGKFKVPFQEKEEKISVSGGGFGLLQSRYK